jgi:exodeoxyribonuclease VII small subunit
MSKGEPKESSLGEELKALEEIVRRLESDGIDLDEALRLFEEGVARLRRARARLGEAEQSVKAVLASADGTLRMQDVDL